MSKNMYIYLVDSEWLCERAFGSAGVRKSLNLLWISVYTPRARDIMRERLAFRVCGRCSRRLSIAIVMHTIHSSNWNSVCGRRKKKRCERQSHDLPARAIHSTPTHPKYGYAKLNTFILISFETQLTELNWSHAKRKRRRRKTMNGNLRIHLVYAYPFIYGFRVLFDFLLLLPSRLTTCLQIHSVAFGCDTHTFSPQ